MLVFLDTEFTAFHQPQLLSAGLVTLDGRELYAELDLDSEWGRKRLAETSRDTREMVVEDRWGLYPDAVCDADWSLGMRIGTWLQQLSSDRGGEHIEIAHDFEVDAQLLERVLRECNLWPELRPHVTIVNCANTVCTIGPELAAEAVWAHLQRQAPPLLRHHALADALALRAAWRVASMQPRVLLTLLEAAGGVREDAWLHAWLPVPCPHLANLAPLDVLDGQDGLQLVLKAVASG